MGTHEILFRLIHYVKTNRRRLFKGSIPPEIGNATALTALFLYDNMLSSSLPDTIGNLLELDSIELDGNVSSFADSCASLIFSLGRNFTHVPYYLFCRDSRASFRLAWVTWKN